MQKYQVKFEVLTFIACKHPKEVVFAACYILLSFWNLFIKIIKEEVYNGYGGIIREKSEKVKEEKDGSFQIN